MITSSELVDLANAAYWLRAAAGYIDELHRKLDVRSTSYADSLRIEAHALEQVIEHVRHEVRQ